ncbi:hypothetical protein QR680_015295 [Steinernema hermaphroditum]|nr:hypothetical protein QR680_015295 [Steinernema hermaphroditum]
MGLSLLEVMVGLVLVLQLVIIAFFVDDKMERRGRRRDMQKLIRNVAIYEYSDLQSNPVVPDANANADANGDAV